MSQEHVLFVEFRNRKPFSVIVSNGRHFIYIDIEYSRIDGWIYWHESGSGPPVSVLKVPSGATYWLADDAGINVIGGKRILSSKYARHPRLYYKAEETETIWCDKCGDVRATTWVVTICPHIKWCDKCAVYRTQNGNNECSCDE